MRSTTRYFSTWRSYPYQFISPEVRERHARTVSQERPAVVLTELRDIVGEYYDISRLDCVPRSKYRPDMLIEPCRKYEQGGKMPGVHWTDFRLAVSKVRSLLVGKEKTRPIKLEEVPFDPTKNSGLPYLTRKGDVYEVSLERARACMKGACPPPMTMFSRGKNLDVARPVLAGPFEWQLVEGRFFYPLQELLTKFDNPYLVGQHSCTVAAKVSDLASSPYVLCMDYSGYDGSLSGLLINSAFGILRKMLILTDEDEAIWKAVVSYFITAPILCPDQRVYVGKRHGVPSGSMFTQAVDTICNMITIEYVALRTHAQLGRYYAVGDDSVVALEGPVPMEDIVSAAAELGLTVSATKSKMIDTSIQGGVEFLGHTYDSGLPERTIEKTLEKLLTPERLDRRAFSKDWEKRKEYYIERVRAYQEDNVGSEAWRILRHVETRMKFPNAEKFIIDGQSTAMDRHFFGNPAIVERERWDPNRRLLRYYMGRRMARAAVWWA